ncbi:GxxExxY protein [soil metagenome]
MSEVKVDLKKNATEIVDASIRVHKEMGQGLLESVYQHCLLKELQIRSVRVEKEVAIPLVYRGYDLTKEYVSDILVEDEIILELKAVESILPVHQAQLISYLKLADKKLGFLLNFNVPLMKNGLKDLSTITSLSAFAS